MSTNRLPAWRVLAAAVTGTLVLRSPLGAEPPGAEAVRAGAHAIDSTPQESPVSVNGGMQARQAQAAHNRRHARCLVRDDGATRPAVAVCDSGPIPRGLL